MFEIYPWIEGDVFEYENRHQLEELGRMLAGYHLITKEFRTRRKNQKRESDPERLLQELDSLLADTDCADSMALLREVRRVLGELNMALRDNVYDKLPQAIIHGDLHPGNVKFCGNHLAGLFDFDWANRQERIRDVSDGIMFFAGRRESNIKADNIWSLTSSFNCDPEATEAFLDAYDSVCQLGAAEKNALPFVMAARWLQVRIRGMRKVPTKDRISFLDRGDLLHVLQNCLEFKMSQ